MVERARILVVEDDPGIREGVVDALTSDGFKTFEAATGDRGLHLAITLEYELLLLDLVLPGRDGLDILQQVRVSRPTLPVIILTARGDESDRIRGLKLGADDYVVKPFSVQELLARVEAVLRRTPERPRDVTTVVLPDGEANLAHGRIQFADGRQVDLSEREAELLRYLACNPGRVISRQEILTRVWRLDPRGIETRTIDVHIARLREKLGDDSRQPAIIRTVHGQGYLFQPTERR